MEAIVRFNKGGWHDKIFFWKITLTLTWKKAWNKMELQANEYNRRLTRLLRKKKKGENSQYYHSLSSDFIFMATDSWDLERFSPLTGLWTIPTCFWTEAFM